MGVEGPFLVRVDDADEPPAGVVVPVGLAGLLGRLVEYGLGVLAERNGGLPQVPALDVLRTELRTAAASPGGHPRRILAVAGQARSLTVGEAAQVMGVSQRHVRRLAAAGAVIAHRQGRDWLIDAAAAADYHRRRAAWQQQQERAA
jgi:excisionase family DNA binding protein